MSIIQLFTSSSEMLNGARNIKPGIDWGFQKKKSKKGVITDHMIKGTVRVSSSDPPYKDGNARLTTVPLKP